MNRKYWVNILILCLSNIGLASAMTPQEAEEFFNSWHVKNMYADVSLQAKYTPEKVKNGYTDRILRVDLRLINPYPAAICIEVTDFAFSRTEHKPNSTLQKYRNKVVFLEPQATKSLGYYEPVGLPPVKTEFMLDLVECDTQPYVS